MEEQVGFDNRNLYERVYLYIRDQIIFNRLEPGTRIDYKEFMTELQVSRTPLRDALNRLQRDGLIEVKPRSGTYVSVPRVKDIAEIYDLRKALERQALHSAALNFSKAHLETLMAEAERVDTAIKKNDFEPFFKADRNLHGSIIYHSQNQRLIAIMDTLELQIKWFGVIMTKNYQRPLQANDMHKKILAAIIDGQVVKAQQLLEEHIEEVKLSVISDYSR
jgi:GntR family transcriptional regulator, rspAB operon transcriptional repressor